MFKLNRERLSNCIKDNSLVILSSGREIRKSADEYYNFTVNKNFYYFTNITEPNDIFIQIKKNNIVNNYLFIVENDPKLIKWVGEKISIVDAIKNSEIENVYYLSYLNEFLNQNLDDIENIYIDLEDIKDDKYYNYQELKKLFINKKEFNYFDVLEITRELRLKKSEFEIEMIKKAISITEKGINEILKKSKPNMYEYQLESIFDQKIKYYGATDYAFKSIFASGKNGCTLHYSKNNSIMEDNTLLLVDLGAQYNYYNADISRTFPVNGKYTDLEKKIYDIVLRGQKHVINNIKIGLTLRDLNNILIEFYYVELKKLGLVKEISDVSKYYYHSVSHHLGLDTHDDINRHQLEEYNVITVEPGLYIEEYNIGIRIEDDVLILKDGVVVLSSNIVKEIDDIEKAMNE